MTRSSKLFFSIFGLFFILIVQRIFVETTVLIEEEWVEWVPVLVSRYTLLKTLWYV